MWHTILITLAVDFGGLLLVYLLLRDRVRRATSAESRISEIRDEVSRLLVELNQATDRNIALMEDKITVLNEAISTADKKIGLLRRETEKHDVGSQIYSRLAEGRHPRAAAAAASADAEIGRAARTARPAPGTPSAAPRYPAAVDSAPPAVPLAVELSEQSPRGTAARIEVTVDPVRDAESAGYRGAESAGYRGAESAGYRDAESAGYRGAAAPDVRQRVMMLYRAGFLPSLIASRVGAPVGEVELIISLEQRKGQA